MKDRHTQAFLDVDAKLLRAVEIAKDIIARGAWRDHWEPDYMGGENVRRKIREIATLLD